MRLSRWISPLFARDSKMRHYKSHGGGCRGGGGVDNGGWMEMSHYNGPQRSLKHNGDKRNDASVKDNPNTFPNEVSGFEYFLSIVKERAPFLQNMSEMFTFLENIYF